VLVNENLQPQMNCHICHCVSGEKAEKRNRLVERKREILQKLCHYDDS
jgi:hypothetical protein